MKGICVRTGRVNSASQLDRVLELLEQGLDPLAISPATVALADAVDALLDAPMSQKLIVTA